MKATEEVYQKINNAVDALAAATIDPETGDKYDDVAVLLLVDSSKEDLREITRLSIKDAANLIGSAHTSQAIIRSAISKIDQARDRRRGRILCMLMMIAVALNLAAMFYNLLS